MHCSPPFLRTLSEDGWIPCKDNDVVQSAMDSKKLREQLRRADSVENMDFMRIPSDFGNTGGEASPLHLASLRDEIQSSFLSYSSPNTSPRRPAEEKPKKEVVEAGEVISGNLQLVQDKSSVVGLQVVCSISNDGLFRIFEGKRRRSIAELRLDETVVGYRKGFADSFILTSDKRFLFDPSRSQECLYIHCDSEDLSKWVSAMVKLGAAYVEVEEEEEEEAPRGPRGQRARRERGESKSLSPEPRGFLSRFL